MRASIIVDGQELATFLAFEPLCFPLEECWHPPFLDIFQVLDEAIIIRFIVPGFNNKQALAWETLAFITEIDLLVCQFLAEPFFMDAAPAPRATPDATGL